ncbi:hypothetical protein [Alteromonas sp. a30]|uniref:hypothetical protein n=1 Tax=Alteromonas sp. a30 TaxID=2730917 RepID=UPI00227E3E14|nr:hypothetical protein [Alteromonas sp. a30]MCY7294208.1 hypothetical protein [Alteromonas sp. a30]
MLDIALKSDDTLIIAVTPAVTFLPGTAVVKNTPSGVLICKAAGSELHITLKGSSHWKSEKKALCKQPDVDSITVSVNYSTATHSIIGVIKVALTSLPKTHVSELTTIAQKDPIVLKGQPFDVQVSNDLKAMSPSDGSTDTNVYMGKVRVQLADPKFYIKTA